MPYTERTIILTEILWSRSWNIAKWVTRNFHVSQVHNTVSTVTMITRILNMTLLIPVLGGCASYIKPYVKYYTYKRDADAWFLHSNFWCSCGPFSHFQRLIYQPYSVTLDKWILWTMLPFATRSFTYSPWKIFSSSDNNWMSLKQRWFAKHCVISNTFLKRQNINRNTNKFPNRLQYYKILFTKSGYKILKF